jgi:hypothetical protein
MQMKYVTMMENVYLQMNMKHRTKLILSSDKNVDFSSSIFVHVIEIKINKIKISQKTNE